jgi:hypothetical protein
MTSSSSTFRQDLVGPFRDSVVLQPDFQKINREYIEVHELMMLRDKTLVGHVPLSRLLHALVV